MKITKDALRAEPQSHWMKDLLKKHNVRRRVAAEMIGVSYTHLNNVLNGFQGISPEIETTFKQIREVLENDSREGQGDE